MRTPAMVYVIIVFCVLESPLIINKLLGSPIFDRCRDIAEFKSDNEYSPSGIAKTYALPLYVKYKVLFPKDCAIFGIVYHREAWLTSNVQSTASLGMRIAVSNATLNDEPSLRTFNAPVAGFELNEKLNCFSTITLDIVTCYIHWLITIYRINYFLLFYFLPYTIYLTELSKSVTMSTELVYREISCTKAVNDISFTQGNQDFQFSMGAPTAWVPSKSYFRITLKLSNNDDSKNAGAQPRVTDQLAFAENVCSGLYNNAYFRAGGQDVSSIVNYIPQAAALLARTTKPGAWLNSIGKSAYMLNPSFQERVAMTASPNIFLEGTKRTLISTSGPADDLKCEVNTTTGAVVGAAGSTLNRLAVGDYLVVTGQYFRVRVAATAGIGTTMDVECKSQAGGTVTGNDGALREVYGVRIEKPDGFSHNIIHVLWQPPIGIFQHAEPMGAGDYRFSLNPNSGFKKACVESLGGGLVAGTDYDINVKDVKLYIATVKTDIPKSVSTMSLMEMLVQTKPAVANRSYEFTVPSSTVALCFFVQSGDAGFNNQSSPTMFKCKDGSQNNLQSLQITYANTTKPSTRWDSAFVGNTNQFQQRYIDDLTECRLIQSEGGAESFGDWLQRGPYYYYTFHRDQDDKSTQVQLSLTYTALEPDAQLFLIAMYSRVTEITVDSGIVQQVRSLNL